MHSTISIKAELKDLLQGMPRVLAAWEGGSAATGYLDKYSDLDLTIVIADDDPEPVFKTLREHFSTLYGIDRQFRMPEPTWHGMSQCFYLLRDCEEFFYCDIAVVTAANPHKLTEPDRHGNALIWFDKGEMYTADNSSPEEQEKIILRILSFSVAIDFLSIIELEKALARGSWLASLSNFQTFVNRHLIPLLNIKYRPWKADFGIRYIERDYPQELVNEIQELLRYQDVDDLRHNSSKAINMYNQLKDELLTIYPAARPKAED